MANVEFPRCIYHGPDAKGCYSAEDWEKARAAGWTLTPDPAHWGGDGTTPPVPEAPGVLDAPAIAPAPEKKSFLRGKRR